MFYISGLTFAIHPHMLQRVLSAKNDKDLKFVTRTVFATPWYAFPGMILLGLTASANKMTFNEKNQGFSQYKTFKADDILFYSKFLSKWVCDKFNISEFDNVLYQNTDVNIGEEKFHLEKDFPAKTYIHCKHHHSHAAGAFYQNVSYNLRRYNVRSAVYSARI